MKIHLNTLTLQCRKSREIIDLSNDISFFHGKVSSGKSSIARIIDFCLGGDIERTPAIMQELVSVSLEAVLNGKRVLFERDAVGSEQVIVTWLDKNNDSASVLAPVNPNSKPIWKDNIYSLSDLILYLLGIKPILIPSNKNLDDAKLSRLSFRNFMWYCYLDQHHLDSSFYRLEDSIRQRNSREIMKFVMQYSNQRLIDMEADLVKSKEDRNTKLSTAKELRSFLSKFGYSTVNEIEKEIDNTQKKLFEAKQSKKNCDSDYVKETHFADTSRDRIRGIANEIENYFTSIVDLEKKLLEQESLRSELISSKFKLARTETATNILSGVQFSNCPKCGSKLNNKPINEDQCNLCGSNFSSEIQNNDNAEIIRRDVDSRIKDIEISILNHKEAFNRQKKVINKLQDYKKNLEVHLFEQLKIYESAFLSNVREIDRKVATYEERLKGQQKLKEMPQAITKLEKEADELLGKEHGLKRDIENERQTLVKAEQNVKDLENAFLSTLLTIGLPGISEDDEVHINRKTWEVFIYPMGEEYRKWNFSNAGSGGKRTMFNVCYLLSLHLVASKNRLQLPSFMIIDTPMKNIDKEVNEDLFKRFYDYLYSLADSILHSTQIIIIDNSFCGPNGDRKFSFFHRYMTDTDDKNPPLITYYRGA